MFFPDSFIAPPICVDKVECEDFSRMKFVFRLFTLAAICLTSFLNVAWAAGSCHIHPLGADVKDAESRVIEWYSSLEECEMANKEFFGGRGTCHCFPDGMFNGINDDWRSRPRDHGTPQDLPSE
jgi:hypothetical protein